MRRVPVLLLSLMVVISCNNVHHEEESDAPPEPVPEQADFVFADSVCLAGGFTASRDTLLSMLAEDPALKDQVLLRLLGLYHGRALETDFVHLLDSLELEGLGSLTGWKISALDLAGDPEAAMTYAAGSDPFLKAWLQWESDSTETVLEFPQGAGPGEVYVLAMCSPSGSLARDQLMVLSEYQDDLPSVRNTFLRELGGTADSIGTWREDLLRSLQRSPAADSLLLSLMSARNAGTLSFWKDAAEGSTCCTGIAASELAERFSGLYSPSWHVSDQLAQQGFTTMAQEYSASGDEYHRTGAEMSVLLAGGNYDELLSLVNGIDPSAPDSLRARAALFRAYALRDGGRGGSIYYPAFLDFSMDHPWHPMAREAAYNAGKYYDCEQEWSRAAEAYMVSLRSSGAWGGDERAHWRCGFCSYMAGDRSRADSIWARGCESWPCGYWRDEMLFWRARLAGESGNVLLRDSLLLAVREQHPWEFYGMLASLRMGSDPSPSFPGADFDLMRDPACSTAVALISSGYGVPAVELLWRGSSGSEASRAMALSLMGRHGQALSMLRIIDSDLREHEDAMLPDSLLAFYFPAPYKDLALQATDTLELDADMLQGIMREESYFNRLVVSRAGAMGVVQLMPGTASDVARWYGLPYLQGDDFFVPYLSVPYGALYINRQLESYNGEHPLFLAAYNAGPGNATRWVDMHGWNPSDPELYIEQITYRETRIYVKKVLRSAWIYERR